MFYAGPKAGFEPTDESVGSSNYAAMDLLIGDRTAVLVRCRPAEHRPRSAVEHDPLCSADTTSGGPAANLMAPRLELLQDFFTDSRLGGYRQSPAMIDSRHFDGLLHTHIEIYDIQENLDMLLRLYGAAHAAKSHEELTILERHRWNDGVKRTFVRFDDIDMARLAGKQSRPVLQGESCARGNQSGAKSEKTIGKY